MAVAPIHGKGTRVLVDQKDLSPFLKQTTISASMEASDVTTSVSYTHLTLPTILRV